EPGVHRPSAEPDPRFAGAWLSRTGCRSYSWRQFPPCPASGVTPDLTVVPPTFVVLADLPPEQQAWFEPLHNRARVVFGARVTGARQELRDAVGLFVWSHARSLLGWMGHVTGASTRSAQASGSLSSGPTTTSPAARRSAHWLITLAKRSRPSPPSRCRGR